MSGSSVLASLRLPRHSETHGGAFRSLRSLLSRHSFGVYVPRAASRRGDTTPE
jgi:hypothetical protein